MNAEKYLAFARALIEGHQPDDADLIELARTPESQVFDILPGADALRRNSFGVNTHLCCIVNGKSGKCSEDCVFCAQSGNAATSAPVYPLIKAKYIQKGVAYARRNHIHRFSIVTSGRRLPKEELGRLADAFSTIHSDGIEFCASLGILDSEDFHQLKQAGVSRYHHNLETAESHFKQICTTHTYKDRIKTVVAAKEAGMRVCAGALFGIGETDRQVLELAMALRDLGVDSIPVNFLIPIPGTRLESQKRISPLRCLKIIALLRYVLFDKEIIVCGGRGTSLGELHPLVFYAGASGIMTGNFLTAPGRTPLQDLEMIKSLGLVPD